MRRPRLALSVLAWCVVLASSAVLASPSVAAATSASPTYYVSLGDSYAVGYQPGLGSTPGYTVYVARHTHMVLRNFGCGGATTTTIIDAVGCPDVLPHTAGGVTYPSTTQIAAAEAFITAHRGHIGLITVIIGGNDVTGCALQANPISCVTAAVQHIDTNVTTLAAGLRAAAGPAVPLIGLTYPDVILGSYVYPQHPASAAAINLAKLSVTAFKLLINPALTKAYTSASGAFLDITRATAAYLPLTRTVKTTNYGTIPIPVAAVCTLTWFCAKGDIHARTKGYTVIGELVVNAYVTIERRR